MGRRHHKVVVVKADENDWVCEKAPGVNEDYEFPGERKP